LPRPIVIPEVMTLKTLGDVRALIEKHLPAESRARSTWKHVETLLAGAARGDEEPRDLVVALRLVFQIEGIECRPK
jgi:hypothetical protein